MPTHKPSITARQKAREKRAFEKHFARCRQHGFYFVHRWGHYVLPFTKSIKRLGENGAAFQRLWERLERWLVPGPSVSLRNLEPGITKHEQPVIDHELRSTIYEHHTTDNGPRTTDNGPRTTDTGQRNSTWFRWIAAKVARALAQVLWLRVRLMRERSHDLQVRLEARLRTMAEMQAVLRGRRGVEAQARLRETLLPSLGPALNEYRLARMYGRDPYAIFPLRFHGYLAEMIGDAIAPSPQARLERTRLRNRTRLLLEAYHTAAGLDPGGTAEAGAHPSSKAPGASSLADRVAAAGEAISQLQSERQRIRAALKACQGTEPAGSSVRAELEESRATVEIALAEGRAERRRLKALAVVEAGSAESLGNPFAAPSEVNDRASGRVRPKRKPTPEGGVDPSRSAEQVQNDLEKEALQREALPAAERERADAVDRDLAALHGLSLDEMRRRRAALPGFAPARLFWHPERGFCMTIRSWRGERVEPVRQNPASREFGWWPEGLEAEMRARVQARRRHAGGAWKHQPLGYTELSRLVGRAFGMSAPMADGAPPASSPAPVPEKRKRKSSVVRRQSSVVRRPLSVVHPPSPAGRSPSPGSRRRSSIGRRTPAAVSSPLTVVQAPVAHADFRIRKASKRRGKSQITNRKSPISNRHSAIVNRQSEVARLLWLLTHEGERRAEREARRLKRRAAAGPAPHPQAKAPAAPELPFSPLPAPPADTLTSYVASCERDDFEGEFRGAERLARLRRALGRLLAALHGENPEFERLQPPEVWFKPELKRTLRQDLGLDPAPAPAAVPVFPSADELAEEAGPAEGGSEMPLPPLEAFVKKRRQFLEWLDRTIYIWWEQEWAPTND
ncbi:MAG TPA: hypothetical protein VL523_17950 [Terriglobia bacterium]|nr:hypothetical protein [Terriglobia bacterium]